MIAQIELVRNDTLPNFGGTVDFDLTGYTVTLHIGFPTVLIKTGTVSSCTSTSSNYDFTFAPTDLSAVAGIYDIEIQFDDGAGGVITYKKDSRDKLLKLNLLDEIV
ncbi:hypothetical protein KAI46_03990 [bacterium]|nr:hypothetical protein [bacterium]